MKRIIYLAALIGLIVVSDQISKSYIMGNFYLGESVPVINGFFDITYVRNSGVAWGMGAGAGEYIRIPLFLILPTLACCWLVYMIWTGKRNRLRLNLVYTLILAGAIGNLIDRFSQKFVVDFFDFYCGYSHFPAFNIADSCITIAASLWIIDSWLQSRKEKKNAS